MNYSYTWLQKHIEEKLPAPEQVAEIIHTKAFEVEKIEKKGDDTIFDIAVLPDRAGDCLSHYGMAREIAGLLGLTLKPLEHATLPVMPLLLPVEVKSELCRRYIAVRIDGVKVGPSPEWLKAALEGVGQRSINNIVDATNYVLFDLGQPTHAYDAAQVDNGIIVRLAHEGETIITLSDETKTLKEDMLLITDYLGALGIAGVKGGKNAQIIGASSERDLEVLGSQSASAQPDIPSPRSDSALTTSIILEIANFDPVSVRKTARTLSLPTDAAKRFENNLSPVTALLGAATLAHIIKDVAGGEITGVTDVYPNEQALRSITFSVNDIGRILGDWVTGRKIGDVFDRYHYEYTFTDGVFTLTVPYWRADIAGAHDIAEEIGRVIGYDTIVPKALPTPFAVDHSPAYLAVRAAKAWLVHDGYREVMTYTFCNKGEVEIARGAKGKSALRTNLSDALKESYDLNRLNAPLLGLSEIKLFEIGTVFSKDASSSAQGSTGTQEEVHVATAEKGMIKETTLEQYLADQKIVVENSTLELTPTTEVFKPWSLYPFIARDIAVWVSGDADKEALEKIISEFSKQYCVRPAVIFDQFTKPASLDGSQGVEQKTSVAYRLVFQSFEKTLTETDVEAWMAILTAQITAQKSFVIR